MFDRENLKWYMSAVFGSVFLYDLWRRYRSLAQIENYQISSIQHTNEAALK